MEVFTIYWLTSFIFSILVICKGEKAQYGEVTGGGLFIAMLISLFCSIIIFPVVVIIYLYDLFIMLLNKVL